MYRVYPISRHLQCISKAHAFVGRHPRAPSPLPSSPLLDPPHPRPRPAPSPWLVLSLSLSLTSRISTGGLGVGLSGILNKIKRAARVLLYHQYPRRVRTIPMKIHKHTHTHSPRPASVSAGVSVSYFARPLLALRSSLFSPKMLSRGENSSGGCWADAPQGAVYLFLDRVCKRSIPTTECAFSSTKGL